MRKIIIAAVLACLAFSVPVLAGTLDHDFEQGNKYYSDGQYDQAITEYQKVLQAGYHSSELYYNLGNACFREGQLGRAILFYTRARQLDPRDDDIRANLDFARQFAVDKIEVTEETILLDYVNRFFDSFSLNEITWLTVILYLISAAMIFAGYIYRRIRIPSPAMIAVLSIFLISTLFTGIKLDRDVVSKTGVIVAQQAEVKNGPGEDFKSQFTAHAGLMFKIERQESGYYLVNFENRLKGWVPKSAVAQI